MTTKGTKEWADSNINFQQGCKNGCLYCYACNMAIRFTRFESLHDWTVYSKTNLKAITTKYKKRKGRIMFPTSHDLFPTNYSETKRILEGMLSPGNEVLITTKPSFYVINSICTDFWKYKEQIQFRFTIGTFYSDRLQLWEPNAPSFDERLQSLKWAYKQRFKTSVSIEPYLSHDIDKLINTLEPYVSETIWIGIMNRTTLPPEGKELYPTVQDLYSKEYITKHLPSWEKESNGKLRLKDSIRAIMEMK